MNTIGFTKKTETAFDETIEALSDETLDQVAGGINPQPLPPRSLPPGCKGGGNGPAKFRSLHRKG